MTAHHRSDAKFTIAFESILPWLCGAAGLLFAGVGLILGNTPLALSNEWLGTALFSIGAGLLAPKVRSVNLKLLQGPALVLTLVSLGYAIYWMYEPALKVVLAPRHG
jgi:hypothetical protein